MRPPGTSVAATPSCSGWRSRIWAANVPDAGEPAKLGFSNIAAHKRPAFTGGMMKLGTFGRAALMLAGSAFAAAAVAQTVGDEGSSTTDALNIPANPEIFGERDPSVITATAIVNGHVITGTDVAKRTALILLSNQATQVPAEELQRLRDQVLRTLLYEKLQITAPQVADITVQQI